MLAADRLLARGGLSSTIMISGCGFLAFRSAGVWKDSSLVIGGGVRFGPNWVGMPTGSFLTVGRAARTAVGGLVSVSSFLSSGGISPFSQKDRRSFIH
jgi:hypothetical protein